MTAQDLCDRIIAVEVDLRSITKVFVKGCAPCSLRTSLLVKAPTPSLSCSTRTLSYNIVFPFSFITSIQSYCVFGCTFPKMTGLYPVTSVVHLLLQLPNIR